MQNISMVPATIPPMVAKNSEAVQAKMVMATQEPMARKERMPTTEIYWHSKASTTASASSGASIISASAPMIKKMPLMINASVDNAAII